MNIDSLEYYSDKKNLIKLHRQLQKIDTSSFNKQDLAKYYYYKGNLSFFEDNNEEAINNFQYAKIYLSKRSKNYDFIFKVNLQILGATSATKEYVELPLTIITENCQIAQETQKPEHLYYCQHYKFANAIDKVQTDKAFEIISELYNYVNKNNLIQFKGAVNSNLAHTYLRKKSFEKALQHYLEAEKSFKDSKDSLNLAYIYNNIGIYYKIKGDYENAILFFNKALTFPIKVEQESTKMLIIRNIADVSYFKGDYKEAALNYEKYALKSDDLNREEQAAKIEYYNKKYESIEREKEILRERTKKKRNQNIAIILGTFLLLGSIIAYLTYRSTKRKQRIAEQEKELEIQKTTQILKEKEVETINAMVEGQEKERIRLAGELHDNLGSTLATVKMQVENLERNLEKVDDPKSLLHKTNSLINEAYQKVRRISHERNSGVMAKEGLLPAVQKLAKQISSSGKLQIEVQDFGLENRLSNHLEITIFRMVQELTTNIVKHANAREASISLTQHDNELNIIVEDNGKGFKVGKLEAKNGMGLGSIERRVEHLEGSMEVDSTLGKGTNIIIDIPLGMENSNDEINKLSH